MAKFIYLPTSVLQRQRKHYVDIRVYIAQCCIATGSEVSRFYTSETRGREIDGEKVFDFYTRTWRLDLANKWNSCTRLQIRNASMTWNMLVKRIRFLFRIRKNCHLQESRNRKTILVSRWGLQRAWLIFELSLVVGAWTLSWLWNSFCDILCKYQLLCTWKMLLRGHCTCR